MTEKNTCTLCKNCKHYDPLFFVTGEKTGAGICYGDKEKSKFMHYDENCDKFTAKDAEGGINE